MRLLSSNLYQSILYISIVCLLLGVPSFAEDSKPSEQNTSKVKKYYVNDIKKAMMDHLDEVVDDDGIFKIYDEKTGETLSLKFKKIHDPVRVINSTTYFACTDFHVVGNRKKLYDIDFWMSPHEGVLKIYKTKIHKEPRKSLIYGWYKQPRYTFVDDEIVEIY